jgi:hypothetical protein
LSRIVWSSTGSRFFEVGVDRGVLYVDSAPGVPWVGLTAVQEKPSGGKQRSYYQDGVKYLMISDPEEFTASISAYTFPTEFEVCDGTVRARPGLLVAQQRRKMFSLSYRTKIGNETRGVDHGYKIHLVYNAMAAPSSRNHATISDSPSIADFTWDIQTVPPPTAGYKRSSHIIIDSRETDEDVLVALEDILYGTDEESPRIPTLEEIVGVYDSLEAITVTDNGGGLFTITGPDSAIQNMGSDVYEITGDEVTEIDPETYSISS